MPSIQDRIEERMTSLREKVAQEEEQRKFMECAPGSSVPLVSAGYIPLDKVTIKIEKNSKGFNYEVKAIGTTVDEAMALVRDARAKLERELAQ